MKISAEIGSDMSIIPDVAMIGCGASGALICMQLFRQARKPIHVTCIEPRSRLGAGLAYGTHDSKHLLNVPASRMSVWSDQPDHFVRWLNRRGLLNDDPSSYFPCRRDYADYLTDSLGERLRLSPLHHGLHHEPHRAVGLDPVHGGWLIHLEDGTQLWCRQAVIALGNLPVFEPIAGLRRVVAHPAYVHDPWQHDLSAVEEDQRIVIIGSGLTALDQLMTLERLKHRGAMTVISRSGRWPGTWADQSSPLVAPFSDSSLRGVLHELRQRLATQEAHGGCWQDVIDGMRGQTSSLWCGFSDIEKARFCRLLQSIWNRARHKMPPETAERVDTLTRSGQLNLVRCRNLTADADNDQIRLEINGGAEPILADRVINCTGTTTRLRNSRQPLIDQMLESGLFAEGPCGLGLANDETGRLLDRSGRPHRGLFTIGPMRQGSLWESTAIPEIREQAAWLSALVLESERAYGT
jgi:uncharacterized NAD(P)/FAD-binding protein YdhS